MFPQHTGAGGRAAILDQLPAVLKAVTPTLQVESLANSLSSQFGFDAGRMRQLMSMLLSMYSARLEHETSAAEFTEAIFRWARACEKPELASPSDRARAVLADILSLDQSLGLIAKALSVMSEHERMFMSGRIVTDIRPIFRPDLAEQPGAAIIVHELRVAFNEAGESREFFVAMDSKDVKALQAVLQRALQKEENLRKYLGDRMLCLEGGQ